MKWSDVEVEARTGQWRLGATAIEVYDIEARDIYTTPWEPGFVCWVCFWQELDGTMKCAFTEARGDAALWPPAYDFNRPGLDYYAKTLVSYDSGLTWTDTGWCEPQDRLWVRNSDHHWRRTIVMPDGSLLRVMPRTLEGVYDRCRQHVHDAELEGRAHDNLPKTFPFRRSDPRDLHGKRAAVWRSADGGQTWKEIYAHDPSSIFIPSGLIRCREGHLLMAGNVHARGREGQSEPGPVGVCESVDGGLTWSEPCPVLVSDGPLKDVRFTEENDMIQLHDGRVFLGARTWGETEFGVQACLTRTGPGTYETDDIRFTPWMHNANPILLQATDGTIWFAGDGCNQFATADQGHTWDEFKIGWSYYAQMLEAEPGCLLHISQYGIGDSPFPHVTDSSIRQTRFQCRRADVLEQTDAREEVALALAQDATSADVHLHVWVQAKGCGGLAFRAQPDDTGAAYVYFLATRPLEPEDVSDNGKVDVFHVLGKVDGAELSLLRRRYIGEVSAGRWLQMQVRTEGDLLQGAVRLPDERGDEFVHYLSARDDAIKAGASGVVTLGAAGAFKTFRRLGPSQSIRDGWWKSQVCPEPRPAGAQSGRALKPE